MTYINKKGLAIGLILLFLNIFITEINMFIYKTYNLIYFFHATFIIFLTYVLAATYCNYRWHDHWWQWLTWLVFPTAVWMLASKIISFPGVLWRLFSILIIFVFFLSYIGIITNKQVYQALSWNIWDAIMRGTFLVIIPIFIIVPIIGLYVFVYLFVNVFVYLYYGYEYGKLCPQLSWVTGILLTFPWFFFTYGMFWQPSYGGGDVAIVFDYLIIFGFINLFMACIGAYIGAIGARIEKQKKSCHPDRQ